MRHDQAFLFILAGLLVVGLLGGWLFKHHSAFRGGLSALPAPAGSPNTTAQAIPPTFLRQIWLFIVLSAAAGSSTAAVAPDPELIPHSDVKFEKRKIRGLPPYVPRRLANGQIERLTRKEVLAELLIATGVELNERGNNPFPAPVPRLSCRFEVYSAIDHGWMKDFVAWTVDESDRLDLSFRDQSWDCDDFSMSLNAMADLAMLRSAVHCPPPLIGRLIVN